MYEVLVFPAFIRSEGALGNAAASWMEQVKNATEGKTEYVHFLQLYLDIVYSLIRP